MARKIRLTPYDEQMIGEFEENATGLDLMAYGSTLPMTTDSNLLPEDPMPLFLASDDEEEPRTRGFGSGGDASLHRAVRPRILKVGVFVAVAAAIAFAVSSVENPLALFANAKASLNGSPADQAGATPPLQPVAAVQPASSAPPTPVVPSTVGVAAVAPAAQVAPTRGDLALALKTVRQNLTETARPQAAAAPARRLDADDLANLLNRAQGLIAVGDIAPARLLLERAADAQEARAALLLAQTYDPAVLGAQDMRSITPDPAKARDWYQKAARLGSVDARQRLAQMQN
ncbi:MAG TPA: SEL1-like repeat protein [Bradyrhizobium sp.]|nr:SEL1-like repeat protein [Bradyrhizobium sp.]